MENNTAVADPSSPPVDATSPDEMARRASTVGKAIDRLAEVSERVDLIQKAIGAVLPELIAHHGLGDATDGLSGLSAATDTLEEMVQALKSRISYAKEVSMPARMDDEQITTFNTDDFRITRTTRVMAAIISEETGVTLERAYAWLRENNYGALIKETVNSSSLSAAAKELMKNGKELPEDLFRTYTKDGVSITKKKK